MPEETPSAVSLPRKQPTVVGIGASAGGLAALKILFSHLPKDSGLAFVIVVHLSPEYKSHLADVLQPHIPIPVSQVADITPLEPNHVYIIPPNANLNAIDTHLRLSKLEESRRERAPIDHFFRTLASTFDGSSIGVILTGTGSDGTLGIKEIKAKGGLAIVQDPNEAEFDGMPQSAITSGYVDRILRLDEIMDTILRIERTEPRVLAVPDGDETAHDERQQLQKIFGLLRTRTERDFSRYKSSTILRRIARRMQLNYVEDLGQYVDKLRDQPEEARALADDFLITVTSFFRDPAVFDTLATDTIPRLFDSKREGEPIRIWSVGCATGEEAYSLAILLIEEAARRELPPTLQIFASDLHRHSLEKAREGFYPGDIDTDVSAERLQRFFQKDNGGYRIRKEVRDLVVFAPHNLMSDPPFSRVDLISCRNLLIYLQRGVQREVIELFHYALVPEGVLLLGSAETIDAGDLFRTEDKKLSLYRKRNVPAPEPRLPVFPINLSRTLLASFQPGAGRAADVAPYASIHQRLMERYSSPSVLIGPGGRLVHIAGNAGRYLVHPSGEMTQSISKLVREELRIELQAALQTVGEQHGVYDTRPVLVRFDGEPKPVVMRLRSAPDADQDGFLLLTFDEQEPLKAAVSGDAVAQDGLENDRARVERLDAELSLARQRMQSVIEEYEASQEEMKASNEEMQSTNEELRSTMEELETSKEELQSINEELQTVNQENRHKVEELAQMTGDLQNLLTATDIATLFLDRGLRILRFTPRLGELFNIRQTDRGRPLFDLTHRLVYRELRNDAQNVLATLQPMEREVEDDAGRWYLSRVLPYRSTEDHIEGVVITFTDITRIKLAEAALHDSQERLVSALTAARMSPYDWSSAGGPVVFSNGASDILGVDPKAIYTDIDAIASLIHPDDRASRQAALQRAIEHAEDFQTEYRMLRQRDNQTVWVSERGRVSRDPKTAALRVRGLIWDITQRRNSEDQLRILVDELNHRVKNILAIAQSIASQTLRHSPAPAEFVARFQGRLQALARAHDLVTQSNWESADIRDIVRQQLSLDGSLEHVSYRGPGARLESRAALALALILHELGTNARKHGSLSVADGRLDLTWSIEQKEGGTILTVDWLERGGPGVKIPATTGFGTEMIQRSVRSMGGEASLRFEPAGLACHIVMPVLSASPTKEASRQASTADGK